MSRNRVLVLEDDATIRFAIRDFLELHHYEVVEAEGCRQALVAFPQCRPDIVITDYMLADGNALELLPQLKAIDNDIPVVVLTGHGSIELAVRAIQEGAEQFLTKPVELQTLLVVLDRIVENRRNRQKQRASQNRHSRRSPDPFIGASAPIRILAEQARRVAQTDSAVLIQGETGAGKGVLARWLHNNSRRAEEAFVDLNCAGLSRELLETELFGHEKGAFTGASTGKMGLLEVAHRGTIFLDEVGDMDAEVQPKLLKVIEEKRFRRLGEVRERQVDIRLIAATHQDLQQLVREKKFRSDLYYRISVVPLRVPALRERVEEIPLIARHLLTQLAADQGRSQMELSPEAEKSLQDYSWPGNIRELRNIVERALLLSEGRLITASDLYLEVLGSPAAPTMDSTLTLEEMERLHIERVLKEEGNHVERAAARLGLPRSSLYQKIKKYRIDSSRF